MTRNLYFGSNLILSLAKIYCNIIFDERRRQSINLFPRNCVLVIYLTIIILPIMFIIANLLPFGDSNPSVSCFSTVNSTEILSTFECVIEQCLWGLFICSWMFLRVDIATTVSIATLTFGGNRVRFACQISDVLRSTEMNVIYEYHYTSSNILCSTARELVW